MIVQAVVVIKEAVADPQDGRWRVATDVGPVRLELG
jgi:hypothetical protein